MSETKTLLHADPKAERYVYQIERTSEHVTVARIERDAQHRWRFHVTAERLVAAPPQHAGDSVEGDGEGFAAPADAIAAARDLARRLLAGEDGA